MIVQGQCQHCAGIYEYEAGSKSEFCPHCGKETFCTPPKKITASGATNRQKSSMKFLPWIIVAVIVGVIAFAAYKWQEEKVSRRNILQALMEIQSATALGVNPLRYGELLTKADSTLNLEKITLSGFGNSDFLSCAENAMHFYREANSGWNNGQAVWGFITEQDFKDFQSAGLNITLADYPPNPPEYVKMVEGVGETVAQTNPNQYSPVPLNEWLSLNWKAADFYIEKMKAD
jgi:hypothetical protein